MLGAVFGDTVGSCYEFANIKSHEFPLFSNGFRVSIPTDDSVMTCAVMDHLLSGKDLIDRMKRWGLRYANAGYGTLFWDWLNAEHPQPYNSWGNGSAMRVSPVALWCEHDDEAFALSDRMSAVSHNHPNALHGARATVHAIRLGLRGLGAEEVVMRISEQFGYDTSISYADLQKDFFFDVSCGGTVRAALVCLKESTSFEEAIRNAVALGGDCDTTAAVVGPMAEAVHGISEAERAMLFAEIGEEFREQLTVFYAHPTPQLLLKGHLGREDHTIWYTPKDRLLLTGGFHDLKINPFKEAINPPADPSPSSIIKGEKRPPEKILLDQQMVAKEMKPRSIFRRFVACLSGKAA